MKTVCWLLLTALGSGMAHVAPLCGQESLENIVDEELADTEDVTELLEQLETLRNRPLDLNQADARDLMTLPWISSHLAKRIISWRQNHGFFKSVGDLVSIEGVSDDVIERSRAYLTVAPAPGRPSMKPRRPSLDISLKARANRRWIPGAPEAAGGPFALPYRLYQRAEVRHRRVLEATVLFEKDPGEGRLNDFSSFYVRYTPTEHLALLVGDYQLEEGGGLVLWGPYRFGKGGDPVLAVQQTNRGLRGYRSVDEGSALSGGAVSFALSSISATAFWSDTRLDASLLPSGGVASLDRSGLHRSTSEESHRDTQKERLWGGRLVLGLGNRLRVGTAGYVASYSRDFERRDRVRDFYAFTGRSNHVIGVDVGAALGRAVLFAEWARSRSGGWAALASARADFEPVTVVGLWRSFEPNFHNFRSRAFADAGPVPRNEQGLYLGVVLRSHRMGELDLSLDQFISPWRTYSFPFRRHGQELQVKWRRRMGRITLHSRVRYRRTEETAQVPATVGGSRSIAVHNVRRTFRLQLDYAPGTSLTLRSRFEMGRVSQENVESQSSPEMGYLLYQQLRWRLRKGWRLEGRWTSFDCRSYDSRLYALESDLPGVWSSTPLFGRGSRWYLLVLGRFGSLRFGFKVAETSQMQAAETRRGDGHLVTTRDLGMYFELDR